mmetsp:Transcript_41127/g.39637  ORF Transcript_41127/g.39637 Transcript_41127/m.39637 type:complete len:184 (-) Transcript_41127:1301-1852(-)|eukprot:CAMPEP_0170550988 /NCGR_PEP_ID=MMETSP0211-20121228/9004_1 /TAXON_ID=311385 /ORGANISM="Pseudokeronopsis sp., Strain OXSARD2" /LENGTH=183 /DNA_ID=CAMNT_0010857863 /DNA_START=617 /DNA_END=1168 /DNA_ORIENTATION=+
MSEKNLIQIHTSYLQTYAPEKKEESMQSLSFRIEDIHDEKIFSKYVDRLFKAIKKVKRLRNDIKFHLKHVSEMLQKKRIELKGGNLNISGEPLQEREEFLKQIRKEIREQKFKFIDINDQIGKKDFRYKVDIEELKKLDKAAVSDLRDDVKDKWKLLKIIENEIVIVKNKLIKEDFLDRLKDF